MTIKERIVKQLDGMDEAELAVLEQIRKIQLEEEFRLLDELAAPMTRKQQRVFEEAVRGR